MLKEDVYIVAAKRTAIGNLNGSLASIPAYKLGAAVIKFIMQSYSLSPQSISQIIMGQVLTGGAGQNPARQASIEAGIDVSVPAWTINQVCGSGLRSIAEGAASISLGQSDIIIAGGQESMSNALHALHLRQPTKMGDAKLIDTMIYDGLTDFFNNYHMGITAENVAQKYNIDRASQDQFAYNSHKKAFAAQQAGRFAEEIIDITIQQKKETVVFNKDEFIRGDSSVETLAKLRPAFKQDGTVTAGNSSGINDGAAAVLLMSKAKMDELKLTPLAKIKSWASVGVDPSIMGIGPVPASRKALELAGWTLEEIDLIEANEAFAAQSLAVAKEIGWDTSKVNVNGGAVALGHPIGASGARVLVSLLHQMQRQNAHKGLATLCIGGGMGIAMCVER